MNNQINSVFSSLSPKMHRNARSPDFSVYSLLQRLQVIGQFGWPTSRLPSTTKYFYLINIFSVFQISLLLFSTALHVHTSNIKKSPKPWQYNTRKVNDLPDDRRSCFCYPEGQLPTVHQLLDSQNNGQERLVIYLYKNVGSEEIKMYTPNSDKQVRIPDIPYEAGDGLLTVTTEHVAKLFQNNPYKIKIYNDQLETLNLVVTDALPIGMNLGEIEQIYPKDVNNLTPDNYGFSGNGYIVDNRPHGENGYIDNGSHKGSTENVPGNGIPNKWTISEGEYSNASPEVLEPNGWYNKIKYSYRNPEVSLDKHNSNVGGVDKYVYTFKTNDGSYTFPSSLQSISSVQHLSNRFTNRYMTFNIWFNEQMMRFRDINLPHDIKSIDNSVLRLLVQKTLSENNIKVGSDGVIRDFKGIVIDAANLELRPMLIGGTVDHQLLQKSLQIITLPKYLPYLEGILVTLVQPPHVLGIIPLGKTYLPETTILDESVGQWAYSSQTYLNNYLNDNTNTYSSAAREPYSFTVKDTYSGANNGLLSSYAYSSNDREPVSSHSYSNVHREPSSSYIYSSNNKEPYSDTTEVSYWSSGPYYSASEEPYLTDNWHHLSNVQPLGERRKVSDAKIKHIYEQPKLTNRNKENGLLSRAPKKPSPSRNILKEDTSEPLMNLNSLESGRRFPLPSLKGAMKTLLYLLNDSPSRRDNNSLGSNSAEEVDMVNESENHNDGGRPDFRIIGGNAATGSGTPLSNKGRSGYNE